jgi:hypothetical protein
LANLISWAGVLLQLIVFVNLAVGIWVIQSLRELDPVLAWYIGAVWLAMLVLIEVVTISFFRRRRWAWTAAIAVFALTLPSIAGIVGFVLLLRPGVREAFTARPAGEGGAEPLAAADRPPD